MRNFSLALAGVVAGSLALSASGTTTTNTWWSETFTYQDGDLTSLTNQAYAQGSFKGVWEPGVGDTSSISNGVLALNTEGTDLKFTPNPYDGAEISTNNVLVDAQVFFVGSDSEPNLGDDHGIQFALFLKVPEEVTAASSNAVMVYVSDPTDNNQAKWMELAGTDGIEDKSWHHIQVAIDYTPNMIRKAYVYIDGDLKTQDGLQLANKFDSADGATCLESVSFRGTGAVDNFVGAYVADDGQVVQHEFTATAYLNGSVHADTVIAPQTNAANSSVTFTIPYKVSGGTITNIVVKGLGGASDASYVVTDNGETLTVSPDGLNYTESEELEVTVSTQGAAVSGASQTYSALEVYYASAVESTGFAKYFADAVGDGSAANPWQIPNLAALKALQAAVASNDVDCIGAYYVQTADIALDAPWEGIGVKGGKDLVNGSGKDIPKYEAEAFSGTYDGGNFTISNFQMESGTDYGALFNSVNNATIMNLSVSFAASTLTPTSSSSGNDTGATFVGVARNSTLSNLTARATASVTTVSASKDMAGIVGYLMPGSTVDSCTNELNVASLKTGRKCGGIALITQEGSGTATIRNCNNSGTATASGGQWGGIVGYVGAATTIDGCENTAAVRMATLMSGGSITLQGVNKGNSGVLSCNSAVDGLSFATVAGDVATFVANNALTADNTYKVMAENATATYEFTAPGSISFDEALATPTYEIDAADGVNLDVTSEKVGNVTTYTAAEPAPVTWTITFNDYDSTQLFVTNGVADNATGYGPATDPTREGYTFVGWTNSVAGGATYATANLPAATANATYTAVYEEDVAPETPAIDIGGGLADYTAAHPGETVPPPVAMDNNGFNASFVAPVAGYYCLMTASTPSGDDADYAVDASTAEYAEAGALVTLTDSNTSATSKFYKIGYSATEITAGVE